MPTLSCELVRENDNMYKSKLDKQNPKKYIQKIVKNEESDLETSIVEEKVVGTCNDFCPAKELQLRKKERLLSKFEIGEGLVPIKEYSRPSAGQASPDALSIRTPETLLTCVAYIVQLIDRFIHKEDPLQLYEFLQDRLRAVRQDMLVQVVDPEIKQRILSTCVRFYVVFGHILSNNPAFSDKLNSQHQLECTKSCLLLPKYSDDIGAIYLLSNMDSPSALAWAIDQSSLKLISLSMTIARCFALGNYVRFFRLLSRLPIMLKLASVRCAHQMCVQAISTMAKGYKAKNSKFPLTHLGELLWMDLPTLVSTLQDNGINIQNEFICWTNEITLSESINKKYCHREQLDNVLKTEPRIENLLL